MIGAKLGDGRSRCMRSASGRLCRNSGIVGRLMTGAAKTRKPKPPSTTVSGQCACGRVQLEFDFPAFWAWHDHSKATQRAHGAAYATYVGVWRSRLRIISGETDIVRFEEEPRRKARSFCAVCGTPLMYERSRSPRMVNIPRALFDSRTGREPRYHIAIEESPEWAYRGEQLGPLRGYPGVLWTRPRRKRRAAGDDRLGLPAG